MGTTNVRPMNLVIQDDDEKVSVAVSAENFRKINEAYKEYSTKGFLKAVYVSDPFSIEGSGVYYYKDGTSLYIVIAKFVPVSPAEDLIFLNRINIKTGEVTNYVKSTADNTVSTLNNPNPSMSRYGKTPGGYYFHYITDQFWMGRRLYTALLPFTFVQGGSCTFEGINGYVVRYEGVLIGDFTSMGSLGGVTKQKTLPYICTPFDNAHSAWLTFKSKGDDNTIEMIMLGANSNVENCQGYVQIWYYDPTEESVS